MKTISCTKVFICLAVFIFPLFTFAFGSLQPFGGRITTVKLQPAPPGISITCPSNVQSPFMISPVFGPAGPWSAMVGPINVGQITPGAWILGLIQAGPGTCEQLNNPPLTPTPYPTTVTDFYGTSAGSGWFNLPI